ncbi:MAG: hypothetical protein C0392_14375 [Syntrophus sp. (in: bacteria)]|nr:hypothetical protein [Syntrophus sp. (in: bacteria)]
MKRIWSFVLFCFIFIGLVPVLLLAEPYKGSVPPSPELVKNTCFDNEVYAGQFKNSSGHIVMYFAATDRSSLGWAYPMRIFRLDTGIWLCDDDGRKAKIIQNGPATK